MGSLLTGAWLEGLEAIPVWDDASVSLARTIVREQGAKAGLDKSRVEAIAAAASELVRNQLSHARRGQVAVHVVRRSGTPAVEVVCADEGAGISDPARAFREEPREGRGLGAGLAAVLRLADEVDFDVRLGEGTCVRARKFASPVERRETTAFGRAHEHQTISGDDAAAVAIDDALGIAIADGLGHGEAARAASRLAISVFRRSAARPLDEILRSCDVALEGTRGAAMSILRIERGRLVHAGIGNVQIHLYAQQRGPTALFTGSPGVLGSRHAKAKIRIEETPLPERHLLVAFTDGLSSRLDATEEPEAFLAPPLTVAQRLLDRFGKAHDDALVIVGR